MKDLEHINSPFLEFIRIQMICLGWGSLIICGLVLALAAIFRIKIWLESRRDNEE